MSDGFFHTKFHGGIKGPPGASAYQIAVKHGFVGTEEEWLESLQGPPGVAPEELAQIRQTLADILRRLEALENNAPSEPDEPVVPDEPDEPVKLTAPVIRLEQTLPKLAAPVIRLENVEQTEQLDAPVIRLEDVTPPKLVAPAVYLATDEGPAASALLGSAVLGSAVLGSAVLGNSCKLTAPVIELFEELPKLAAPVIGLETIIVTLAAPVIELVEV